MTSKENYFCPRLRRCRRRQTKKTSRRILQHCLTSTKTYQHSKHNFDIIKSTVSAFILTRLSPQRLCFLFFFFFSLCHSSEHSTAGACRGECSSLRLVCRCSLNECFAVGRSAFLTVQ